MNLSKRSGAIIVIAIIILILLLVVLVASLRGRGTVSNNTVNSQPARSTSQAFPTQGPYNPFPNGDRYQGATYSIAYPQGSQNSTNTFTGGSVFIVEPPNYPNEPVFDVEAYTSAQNLSQKEELYLATGATKSTITVNNIPLPELRNTYNMRTINSKPIHTPTQLRLAYLVKPNALYVFRMYYSSSIPVQADEALFSQFITSFSLN
jgi:hypothetical protein